MALERRNPLPRGIYWTDVIGTKVALFHDWRTSHKATIKVRGTQESGTITWFLFEVLEETPWPPELAAKLGWPTIAEQGLKQNPPQADLPKNITDQIADALPTPGQAASTLVNTVYFIAAGAAAYLVYTFIKEARS